MLAAIAWMCHAAACLGGGRGRAPLLFYALAAFAMWVFALGPEAFFFGSRALYQAPYGWLMRLPGFDGLRVPARFWMMALVCLTVLAALAIDRLHGRCTACRRGPRRGGPDARRLAGRTFVVEAAPERRPAPAGVMARLDLPINTDRDAAGALSADDGTRAAGERLQRLHRAALPCAARAAGGEAIRASFKRWPRAGSSGS